MTKVAAMELGPDNIRVMSIHPGPIRTPMTEGMDDEMTYSQPIKRFGQPDEVTKLMMFMAADATYSTGCTKEMKLAIEVQLEHPEMQIIGPAKERFLRRSEYGIGKLYDRQLSDISLP